MISQTVNSNLIRTTTISLRAFLLVVFLTLSPILSFLASFGLPVFLHYAIIIVSLYIPLLFGIIAKKIKLNTIAFVLFALIIVYILFCSKNLVDFKDVYLSETNGISARILTFTSSVFGLLFFGIYYTLDDLKSGIKIASYINLVISFFRFFIVTIRGEEFLTYGYDMNFGYTLLFPLLCFISLFYLDRKKRYFFISLFGFLFILLFGSRGPILCLAIFFVLLLFFIVLRFLNASLKFIVLSVIAITAFFAILFFKIIVPFLDLSSLPRSLQYVLNIAYFSSSTDVGRKIISEDLSYYVNNIPLFGYGLLADQGFLGIGKYSHNLFLEIYLTFGPVLSITFLIALLILSLFIFFSKKIQVPYRIIFIALWSFSFGRLIVSNSFWYETYFWCCIAFGVVIVSRNKACHEKQQ